MANTAKQPDIEKGIFLGVVADDFTGASDVASFLMEAGVGTVLFNGVPCKRPKLREGTGAIVVALKTRTEPVYQAVAESMEAFAWLKEMGAAQLYLKYCSTFDSTDKGNIGPVADAVLEAYGLTCTVLCPSLPVNGRTVRDGKLYVNGVLLEESPMKDHPLTPMRKSRIDCLMARQGGHPCVCLTVEGLEKLRRGGQVPKQVSGQVLGQAIGAEGKEAFYIVPDYYEDAHGDLIAELFGDLPFLTGGSGLAGALGRRYMRMKAASGLGASRLGTASPGVASQAGCVRFIVAGGETSGAVAKALGYRSFYIGPAVAPGVPVMIPLDSPDVRLVLKSGNFGQEGFFERALRITGGEQEEA